MDDYNYRNFKTEHIDLTNFSGPRAGERFIDVELYQIDGKKVNLSDFLVKPIVLETGSITCPMYLKGVSEMGSLRNHFPNINFLLIYVREAHPGNKIGFHKTIADKIDKAKRVKKFYDDNRLVLIDDVNGEFHKTYGLLPNIVYLIDTNGIVRFRGDWNSPKILQEAIESLKSDKIIWEEHFEPTKPNPFIMIRALSQGGIKAIWDFLWQMPKLMALHKKANKAHQIGDHS